MRMILSRRIACFVVVAGAVGAISGCASRRQDPDVLRLGFFPNVTHEVALTGKMRGTFARAVAPATIEWKAFGAGPQAVEAILAGAVDVCYLGPGPAENGYLRSRGEALVVIAGAASGGAALVVRRDAGITKAADLHGRRLASPQLGNTQDVALRAWLAENGLRTDDRGGDVRVLPIANPEILTLMQRGDIDGAWVPEPWVARLMMEAGGVVLVDEASLWPSGKFPTAVLAATRAALSAKRGLIAKLVGAHVDEVRWIREHPEEARRHVGEAVKQVAGKALPEEVAALAFARVTPTWETMPEAMEKMAGRARRLRYLPEGELSGLIDAEILDAALAERGLVKVGGMRR